MIRKHIDLVAIGALLFAMALVGQSRRVLLISERAPLRIHVPRAPACPVVVVPNIPRIVVQL